MSYHTSWQTVRTPYHTLAQVGRLGCFWIMMVHLSPAQVVEPAILTPAVPAPHRGPAVPKGRSQRPRCRRTPLLRLGVSRTDTAAVATLPRARACSDCACLPMVPDKQRLCTPVVGRLGPLTASESTRPRRQLRRRRGVAALLISTQCSDRLQRCSIQIDPDPCRPEARAGRWIGSQQDRALQFWHTRMGNRMIKHLDRDQVSTTRGTKMWDMSFCLFFKTTVTIFSFKFLPRRRSSSVNSDCDHDVSASFPRVWVRLLFTACHTVSM